MDALLIAVFFIIGFLVVTTTLSTKRQKESLAILKEIRDLLKK